MDNLKTEGITIIEGDGYGEPGMLFGFLTGIFYYIGVNFFLFGSSSDLARIRLFTEFRYFIHGNIY